MPIEGFVLFEGQDIPGFDIDYVEFEPDDYAAIAAAATRNPNAVGFNYNGYVKGSGGRLAPVGSDSAWLKPGIVPWVCVKQAAVEALTAGADRPSSTRRPSKGD